MANNVLYGTNTTWTTAANWTTASAPVNGDTVFVTNNSTSFTLGLSTPTILLTALNLDMSFTGQVGVNNASANTYLQVASPLGNIGMPAPGGQTTGGPRLFNWDAGTSSTVINVMGTATSGTATGQAPVKLKGTALTVNLTNGTISIAALATETSTVSTLNVTNGNAGVTPQAYIGPGCALTTLVQNAGAITSASQTVITTATVARSGSTLTHIGNNSANAFSVLAVQGGGKVIYNGSGNIGTLTLTGTIDFSGGGSAVTINTTSLLTGFKFIDPLGRVTFTNRPTLNGCSLKDGDIDLGQGRTY